MTQSEFSKKLGFSWSKIKDLESGKLNTTAEIALLIEKIYSVNLILDVSKKYFSS